MIEHDKRFFFEGGGGFFSPHSLKKNNNPKISIWNRGRCAYGRRRRGSLQQKPECYEGVFLFLNYAAVKAPSWTLSSNYPPHPPLSFFSPSRQTFFCSSLSPQIVVIKLVGFCGFEVEQGEKRVYLCFLTGSLRRERRRVKTSRLQKRSR